jgi:hypothetical protein
MSNDVTFKSSVDTGDLRADLESIQLGLGKEVGRLLQRAIEPLVQPARALAPYDPAHRANRPDGLGHIRDSITVGGKSAKSATLISTHPAAAVFEWNDGVTPAIAPRGVPLTIKAVQMAHKAAEARLAQVEKTVADGVSDLIARNGL